MTQTFTPSFSQDLLDPDAVDIARRLDASGFETYFVGGCVRDLLLGRKPKDFDIATAARPEELKQLFGRRCRIIGKRFRLAHVYAGSQCFEVATFRGLPDDQEVAGDDSGFVVRANTFGSPEQDARSRDFTVNGLFYDPLRHLVIDHVDGAADVERRLLRSIGPADQRLREDPVRLLRAVKFAAKLGLEIHPELVASAPEAAPLILGCPTARVSEELFRLAESGHAVTSIEWLERLGALPHLLPEMASYLGGHPEARERIIGWLTAVDRLQRIHGPLPREATFALLVWPFIWQDLEGHAELRDLPWGRYALSHVKSPTLRLALPVRHRQTLAGMFDVLKRMYFLPRRTPTSTQLRHFGVPLALSVLRVRFSLGDVTVAPAYETWASALGTMGLWAAPFEPRGGEDDDRARTRAKPERPRTPPRAAPEKTAERAAPASQEVTADESGTKKKRRRRRKPRNTEA